MVPAMISTPHSSLFLSACVALLLASGCATTTPPQIAPSDPVEALRFDVAYLASDLLEGRQPGTPGEALAADYIARRFAEVGLTPGGDDGGWTQPFTFQVSTNPHGGGETVSMNARNVIGVLDRGAAETIVVGAHYDALGYGGMGSRAPGEEAIHNGADDNASGTAALFAIAERLVASNAQARNVVFVAFSGEEMGLHGSKYFVSTLEGMEGTTVAYMLNLDMVGRLADTKDSEAENGVLAVNGVGTSPAWGAALDAVAEATGLTLARTESGLGPSDHASFYLADIPVLHFFTGQHTDYHTPVDDSHLIDYEGLATVADFAVRVIEDLDDDAAIAFTKTQDQSQRSMSFRVGLGVMPDYVFTGEGMRIDAVLSDRAAERAGLQDGDVVVRLGDTDITDIQTYMEALSSFDVGDAAPIIVERDGERVEATVQF
ncbi:MAG: M20/M25/M40 family metallo-hydrolase [Bacteroidota bacterium]